jgi:hypothetical protein
MSKKRRSFDICALEKVSTIRLGCEALVTGDKTHFGAFYGKTIAGVVIHSPRSIWLALMG